MADNLKHSSVGPELTQDEFESGTLHTIGGVPAGIVIDNKVDKVSGKGLSTEDYTTAEKEKLEAIEESSVSLTTVKADTDIASAISLKHAAVTVSAPIALSGQALSLVNNAGSPATITTISTDGTLAGNSDVYIPTQKAVKTYVDSLCILRGTVTLANARLSLVDGTAFFDCGASSLMTSLLGCKLTITDSAGKKAIGYIKAAGTGETLGDEKITNGDFATGDGTGWTEGGLATSNEDYTGNELTVTMTSTGSKNFAQTPTLANNALYKSTVAVRDYSCGGRAIYTRFGGITNLTANITANGTFSGYAVKTAAYLNFSVGNISSLTSGDVFTVDDISLKQVLTPSTTGVTITSTPGGTTYNWASIESGFNYNDASGYTYYLSPSTF